MGTHKRRIYRPKAFYNSQNVIKQAANRNRVPKFLILKKVLKISLFIGPILALIFWLF